jgi:uncharacterized protein (TIGR03435 family)
VRLLIASALALTIAGTAVAQSPAPAEFDVVSIKKSDATTPGGGMRTRPDGGVTMTNQPIRSIILSASPVQTREVIGLPDWASTERYDVSVKPPEGATRDQIKEMWRAMFEERMKLAAHVEQRERDVYSLVLARSDGRLGPELKKSTLDCGPRPAGSPPPPPPSGPPSPKDFANRCGMMMGPNVIVSGGMPMNNLAASLYGMVGGEVENQTGLDGFYAITLSFSRQRPAAAPLAATPGAATVGVSDDLPDIFTALQEQLGLKLVRGRKTMPVFVVDHIERPAEN